MELGITPGGHDDVVAGLYEAALFPDRWHAALTAVMKRTSADTFHLLAWDRQEATTSFDLYSHEWMTRGVKAYAAYYGAIDPRRRLLETAPVGAAVACHQHISERDVERNEFFQDFLIPGGLRYVTVARPHSDERQDIVLGLMRHVGNRPFGDAELMEAQRMSAHLSRACRLWNDTRPLRNGAAVGAHAARTSGFALIGLDGHGRVAYANAHAEVLLRAADCLLVRCGRLGAALGNEDARLREAIRQARESGCGSSLALPGRGEGSLLVGVAPLPGGEQGLVGSEVRVLITARARDGASRARPAGLSQEGLTQTFSLTAAESAVALALCDGKTLDEHAQAAGVSMATVRTQLRAVFEKTRTRRQAETVGLLLGMPPAE
jgi:DNA-binding CsgD family transcriptional regulator